MAQKVVRELIDDLDGSAADETVTFGIDGKAYELDLSSYNAGDLRDNLAKYMAKARSLGRFNIGAAIPTTRSRGAGSSVRQSREQTQAVRTWARQRGYDISDRGRIPLNIQQEFDAAHAGGQSVPEPVLAPAYHNSDIQIGWS